MSESCFFVCVCLRQLVRCMQARNQRHVPISRNAVRVYMCDVLVFVPTFSIFFGGGGFGCTRPRPRVGDWLDTACSSCTQKRRVEGDMTYKRHCRVQNWKRMYNKLHYGVADRPLNFNKVKRAGGGAGGGEGGSHFLFFFDTAVFDRLESPFFICRG